MKRKVVFYPSQSSDIMGLKRYVEDMLRQIIDVVNGTVEPQYNIISEEPKNPDEGKSVYASGWTYVDNTTKEFKGWNPEYDPDSLVDQDIGDGNGIYVWKTDKAGVGSWNKVG
jgi:hypothetical protein